jgi:hypothetical protein
MYARGERMAFEFKRLETLEEKSRVSPAVASWENRLHLAWTGRDRRLNLLSSTGGGEFHKKRTLSYRSYQMFSIGAGSAGPQTVTVTFPPSLAGTPNGLHLAWTGSDTHLRLATFAMGLDEVPVDVTLAETSSGPCSIAAFGSGLLLGWTLRRPYADVLVSPIKLLVSDGGRFSAPAHLKATSRYRPAVCGVGDQIVVAWTATDRRINIVISPGSPSQKRLHLEAKTSHPPALSSLGDTVVVAWTGTDRHINLMAIRNRTAQAHVRLNQTTSLGPALFSHLDELILAWTGGGGRLNVAWFSR